MRQALPFTVQVWNIKVPLKIKVFLWYLYKGVTLTKDNLARKNWNGNVKCSFCNLSESIQHLFFNCPLAKLVWHIIAVSFNIISPRNFRHIFSHWLGGTDSNLKKIIWNGIAAMLWAIWLSRNDVVFDKAPIPSFLQVIFRGAYWAWFWALRLKEEDRQIMRMACRVLESAAMDVFANNGWRFSNRIGFF